MLQVFKQIIDLHERYLLRKLQTTNYFDTNDPKTNRNYLDVLNLDENSQKLFIRDQIQFKSLDSILELLTQNYDKLYKEWRGYNRHIDRSIRYFFNQYQAKREQDNKVEMENRLREKQEMQRLSQK